MQREWAIFPFGGNGRAENLQTTMQRESLRVAAALYETLSTDMRPVADGDAKDGVFPKKEDVVLLEDRICRPWLRRFTGLRDISTISTRVQQVRNLAKGENPSVMRFYCAHDHAGVKPVMAIVHGGGRLLFVPANRENEQQKEAFSRSLKAVAQDWNIGSNAHVADVRYAEDERDRGPLYVEYAVPTDLGNDQVSNYWWLHQTRAYKNIGTVSTQGDTLSPKEYHVYKDMGMLLAV